MLVTFYYCGSMTDTHVMDKFWELFLAERDPEVLNFQGLGHLLVLVWTRGPAKVDKGKRSYELSINSREQWNVIGCDEDEERRQLLRYRTHFAGSIIRSYYDDDDFPAGVIERVFRNYSPSPEMSPDISFYSQKEYPHRDFALSCGILSSFCFPFYKRNCIGWFPDGVMEIVSTRSQDVGTLRKFCESFQGLDWYFSFPSLNFQINANPEVVHLLEVVCQTFHLPLAQYWIIPDEYGPLRMVHQLSYRDFENLAPWCQFKDACLHKSLGADEGPIGQSSDYPGAFYCEDITALSITQYPFAHYARKCGSIACFTIYLSSISQPGKDWVLEFFLPSREINNNYPQTLLNSLWATVKKCLSNSMLASAEQLAQVFSVEVINSSTQTEPKSFQVGQPHSSLPCHEGSGYTHTLNLFENGTQQRSDLNFYGEAATGETSKGIPNITEIILNNLEEESHMKCVEPQSLASQPKRPVNLLEDEGNTVEMDHSALDMTLEEPSKLEKHTVTAERVNNLVEVSHDEDVEYAVTTASKRLKPSKIPFTLENIREHVGRPLKDAAESFGDVGSAMNTVSQSSDSQTKKSLPHEEIIDIEDDPLVSGHPHQLLIVKDATYNKGFTGGAENHNPTINVIDKTCIEETSLEVKKPEKGISFDILSEHFGKSLDDAANSFHVSRSTFKRICRSHGIKRWPCGKSRMGIQSSSKLRKVNDKEPSRMNYVHSGLPPLQDIAVVAQTSQYIDKINVKATYNGVAIRFELLNSSGMAELEDNVIERLKLERDAFSIKYKDEEGDWVLIACDKDVQKCIEITRSLGKTIIKMLVDLPMSCYAP